MSFQYDPFQNEAIEHIRNGDSVLVAAPTGAGKTAIAEYVIQDCLKRQRKIIYTAPIKALSNQKYRDFSEDNPDQVGILTGDVSINTHAPTLIMTTEIFRNKILEEDTDLKDYAWIIFDEIHYMDDADRGSAWEESLMFLPDHMNVLGLSATVPNIVEMAGWLQAIHNRPVHIVRENKRPVPLHFFFQCQGQVYRSFEDLKEHGYKWPGLNLPSHHRVPRDFTLKPNKPVSLFKDLRDQDALPCIYFTFSRRRTEDLANDLPMFNFLSPEEQKEITALFEKLTRTYDISDDPRTYDMKPLIQRGIAFHHAGMLPTLKEVVERLFTTRLVKVIFTTETFALGINMPARTVIFDDLRKFYERSFRIMKTRDFYQMAGRAGRRSIDPEGNVILRVNPHMVSLDELKKMIYGEPERVSSRFNASYATILNLYAAYQEKLYEVYPLSFHHYQEKQGGRKRALQQLKTKVTFLKESGFIRKNRLTEKGEFAARIYGYEVLLAELHVRGVLEKLSELDFAFMMLAVVFEPRRGMRRPKLSRKQKELQNITDNIILPVHRKEQRMRVAPASKMASFHLSPAIEAWLSGEDFGNVVATTQVDEGEVVRYFRMTIQVMREMLDAPISDALREKIKNLRNKINRGVIDAEKQLRSE